MTTLKFTDGESFDTSGALRIEKRKDGLYVVGEGMLIPVKSWKEGHEEIRAIKNARPPRKDYLNNDKLDDKHYDNQNPELN